MAAAKIKSLEHILEVTRKQMTTMAETNLRRHGTPIPADLDQQIVRKSANAYAAQFHTEEQPAAGEDRWERLRSELTAEYESHAEPDSPATRGQIASVVRLEVEMAKIESALGDARLTDRKRDVMLDQLRRMADSHASLLKLAGIDRRSVQEAKINKSPIEKMDEQVGRFAAYMRERIERFPPVADTVESERDLREAARYFMGWDFRLVDALIRNTKRLNGLEPTVDQYE